jgi:hypothetical protein
LNGNTKGSNYVFPPKPHNSGLTAHFGTFLKIPKGNAIIIGNVPHLPIEAEPQSPISGILIAGEKFGSVLIGGNKVVCVSRTDIKKTFTVTSERRTKKKNRNWLSKLKNSFTILAAKSLRPQKNLKFVTLCLRMPIHKIFIEIAGG